MRSLTPLNIRGLRVHIYSKKGKSQEGEGRCSIGRSGLEEGVDLLGDLVYVSEWGVLTGDQLVD